MADYITSVGMEVHAELLTESKMFCRCPVAFGGMPNVRTCPVCLGLPGTLPVPNHAAIQMVLRTALALHCTIAMDSVFHRKNYFYPDLPKGYQVSQYGDTNPIGYDGYLEIPNGTGGYKKISIRRVHLEEDTGKLMHLPGGGSGVDYNRAGVPLMEIVTEFPPDIQSPEDAREYLLQLRQLLIYIGVCDGKMEEGSLRCEPNISIRKPGAEKFGTKTELKNLNSIRAVQLGVAFETRRQSELLDSGGTVLQETRGWNEQTETSFAMRLKESENDYRYFPDPDLIPMKFYQADLDVMVAALPELPIAKWKRYQDELGLSEYDAGVLVSDQRTSKFFEVCLAVGGGAKPICNWINGDFARLLKESGEVASATGELEERSVSSKITPKHLVDLIELVDNGSISGKQAKEVFEMMFADGSTAASVVAKQGLSQISDPVEIERIVRDVLSESASQLEAYRAGKESLLGFFVGQIMKKSQGRANPQLVQDILKRELGNL